MERIDALELHPTALPPGTLVGVWQVLGRHGRGSYGTVYRAVRQGPRDDAPPVALKLAIHPRDKRFAREVELLARLHHPHVPRLLDHGHWDSPLGRRHPYFVMEWVEGLALYEWAAGRPLSSRQVLEVLAPVARALEATHSAGGVHRDVKGDNILVRPADGRAFLTDFGAGSYVGADTLTAPPLPPGTPRYRSPEAWAFAQRQPSTSSYAAQPADDVFALGVSAYRLVTGEYPPPTAPSEEGSHVWSSEGGGPTPPWELNPRVGRHLGALILRMLSARPEQRPTARELAEALEQAALHAGPEVEHLLLTGEPRARPKWPSEDLLVSPAELHARALLLPPRGGPPMRRWSGSPWLAAAAAGLSLALGVGWALHVWSREQPELARGAQAAQAGDTTSVGDSALVAPTLSSALPPGREGISLDMPSKPLPGQYRPDASGRCPRRGLVAINGGCWLKLDVALEDCDGNGYVHKGGCYEPVFPPTRAPTSSPVKPRDQEP